MAQQMRTLMEAVMVDLDRDIDIDRKPPPLRKPPPPRRDEGPRGGIFWMRGQILVPITGSANDVVSLAGQVVILEPEKFGLNADQIMAMLKPYGNDQYSPRKEYARYLANPTEFDLSRVALLWKASKVVYAAMVKAGWAWVKYNPPQSMHLAMIPAVVKQQMAAVGDSFSLLQIDKIAVTLMTHFENVTTNHPHMSNNRTLIFSGKGFNGSFGPALDWSNGKDAPASNYLYFLTNDPNRAISSQKMKAMTKEGYRTRFGIRFHAQPPAVKDGFVCARVPASIAYSISGHLTPVNTHMVVTLYSNKYFTISPSAFEIKDQTGWHDVSE